MPSMTLDEFKQSVAVKFAPFEIDLGEAGVARLFPVLRLDNADRSRIIRLQQEMQAVAERPTLGESSETDESEVTAKLDEIILLVGRNDHRVQLLLDSLPDMASRVHLFETYQEATELGEVSASQTS